MPSRSNLALLVALLAAAPAAAADAGAVPPDLYDEARQLFEQLPGSVREQFEFPSRAQWDATLRRLDSALQGDSLGDLAGLAAEARTALRTLRLVPGYEDLADWLEQRVDEMEGAQQVLVPRPPSPPGRPPPPVPFQPVPHYDAWVARIRSRPPPARAAALLPRVRAVFQREGVPPELGWLAEAESSFNPEARSPAGARGLFQLMPETAKSLGLRTFLPDERTDPERAGVAAARYLRHLHQRFGNWALALAAYNAGEGRVARVLAARRAATFTAIADALPAETRMYVPKVLSLVAVRAGVPPASLAAPTPKR